MGNLIQMQPKPETKMRITGIGSALLIELAFTVAYFIGKWLWRIL